MISEAIRWYGEGVATIPLQWGGKKPLVAWSKYQEMMPTPEEIIRWFSHRVNIGVITGWQGLTVLDFDKLERYFEWSNQIHKESYTVMTGRPGVHVYLYCDEPGRGFKLDGLDVQAAGRYVVAPPSIHPSGSTYQVLIDAPILRVRRVTDVLPPAWLLSMDEDKPVLSPLLDERKLRVEPEPEVNPWQKAMQPNEQDVISRIKAQIPLARLIPDATPTRDGFMIGRCPLHDDQNPSFWINTKREVGGCFAGCTGRPVDVINLYALMRGITNGEAIHELQKLL